MLDGAPAPRAADASSDGAAGFGSVSFFCVVRSPMIQMTAGIPSASDASSTMTHSGIHGLRPAATFPPSGDGFGVVTGGAVVGGASVDSFGSFSNDDGNSALSIAPASFADHGLDPTPTGVFIVP